MIREREELELVTDEAALRPSDLCVMKACVWCGCDHRFMLIETDDAAKAGDLALSPTGEAEPIEDGEVYWIVVPEFSCSTEDSSEELTGAIADLRLYRVRTGIESEIVGSVPAVPITEPVR